MGTDSIANKLSRNISNFGTKINMPFLVSTVYGAQLIRILNSFR